MKKCFAGIVLLLAFFQCSCGVSSEDILKHDQSPKEEIHQEESIFEESEKEESLKEESSAFVYICGAVDRPGVYEMDSADRLYQVVEEAGGFLESADTTSVNLAGPVEDGAMIYIPTIYESESESQETAPGQTSDGKLNINTATMEQLTSLTGIGEAKAREIISYREKNGPFSNASDITLVSGIGEGIYEKIKDEIAVQ